MLTLVRSQPEPQADSESAQNAPSDARQQTQIAFQSFERARFERNLSPRLLFHLQEQQRLLP
ncbi:MAG: hypothetical protein ACE5JI_19925, partial [Acidobacteriota bacterium]